VALATAEHTVGITYLVHDVTVAPLPVEPAELVYSRFLLTHLGDPASALRIWAELVRPGGRMLIQETARIVSDEPALRHYYELVAHLQKRHRQDLNIGARLPPLARGCGAQVVHSGLRRMYPPPAAMAALHVLNLGTWRDDPLARAEFDANELDRLDRALEAIASGDAESAPIEQDLGELVLERGGG
jgi:trans-aconitate 2-methyltransferase